MNELAAAPVSDRLRSEEVPSSWPPLVSMSLASVCRRPGVPSDVAALDDRRFSNGSDGCAFSASALCAVVSLLDVGDALGCSRCFRTLRRHGRCQGLRFGDVS